MRLRTRKEQMHQSRFDSQPVPYSREPIMVIIAPPGLPAVVAWMPVHVALVISSLISHQTGRVCPIY
jgi:hypothetical protein